MRWRFRLHFRSDIKCDPWNFRMHWRRCLCPQQHGIRRARKLPELHWKTGMCRCRRPSESRHLPTNLLQWRRCLHWAECYSGARQQLLVHHGTPKPLMLQLRRAARKLGKGKAVPWSRKLPQKGTLCLVSKNRGGPPKSSILIGTTPL